MTLKAKWTKITDWILNPDHGPVSGARLTISPPNRQEPFYVSIQDAGNQIEGLTGDGRIYTWKQDSTPKQVSFPAQAPDGFHYLQAAAGSQWQAALGSDKQIYTWASEQTVPTGFKAGQGTTYVNINASDKLLLAVDQQGRIHAFQASQTDGNDSNPKLTEQATSRLPKQAQAVLAVASGSRILALDTEGQAWTWEATNTGNVKPAHIKQNPGTRIIQTAALSKGFLLLDSDGQARYLADNTTTMTPVSLPDEIPAYRITANYSQVIITDKDDRLWAWKPGDKPMRSDNGNQRYVQAAAEGGSITAISRQGSIFTWNLDPQGQADKPTRINANPAPTLESASLDGEALTLSKVGCSWRTNIPAHKPGQAAITIIGKQNNQPFTKSLSYTVNQTLTRGTSTKTGHTVSFDPTGGSETPDPQQVDYPYGRVQRPTPDPTREGYQFDGWFIDNIAYDFSKPVNQDFTLTAKWTRQNSNNTWKINPDKGSQLGGQQTTITPPANTNGIEFNQISASKTYEHAFSLAVGSDGSAYAWGDNTWGQLGDGTKTNRATPVKVRKPAGVPVDFTYVQVSAGDYHSLALGNDGYVYAWGWNYYGVLGNNSTKESLVPVRACDPNSPNDADKGLKAIQVSAGSWQSLALGSDGYAYSWGNNLYGQLGNNTNNGEYKACPVPRKVLLNPNNVSTALKATQVSTGLYHSLAIDKEGNTWAWGYNEYGQAGNSTNNGTSKPNPVPKKVLLNPNNASTALKVTQVSAGFYHSLAIDKEGNTWAWGRNGSGELGNTKVEDQSSVPVPVMFSVSPTITGVTFGDAAVKDLPKGQDDGSVTVLTPAHEPGRVKVSVDYTVGGTAQKPDTSLQYTYTPTGVLPRAGGEGMLLVLATSMTGMGGVLASRRHRRETCQLLHALHE